MIVKKLDRLLRTAQGMLAIALAVALFLAAAPGESAGQSTPEPKQAPAPPPATAIPQAEVAAQAVEVSDLLRTLATNLAPSAEIETIQRSLPELSGQVDREFAGTRNALQELPTFETLQAQQQSWHQRQLQATVWLNLITKRATDLREALSRLTRLHATWTRTRDAAQAAQAPGPILQEIETVLAAIGAAQVPLQAQQDAVLDLQTSVASEVARCDDTLSQITQARRRAVGGMLTRESLPIWSAELWVRALTETRTAPSKRGRPLGGHRAVRKRSLQGNAAARRAFRGAVAAVGCGATTGPAVGSGRRGLFSPPRCSIAPTRRRSLPPCSSFPRPTCPLPPWSVTS